LTADTSINTAYAQQKVIEHIRFDWAGELIERNKSEAAAEVFILDHDAYLREVVPVLVNVF
jgi:hypothetical protein